MTHLRIFCNGQNLCANANRHSDTTNSRNICYSVLPYLSSLKVLSAYHGETENEPSPFPNMKKLNVKANWSVPEQGLRSLLLSTSASDVETSIQVPSSLR